MTFRQTIAVSKDEEKTSGGVPSEDERVALSEADFLNCGTTVTLE